MIAMAIALIGLLLGVSAMLVEFGVWARAFGIPRRHPPVDLDQVIFVDAKSVRVKPYNTVRFDQVAVG
jgi:hypothetical protein